jgi:hypothetical protein
MGLRIKWRTFDVVNQLKKHNLPKNLAPPERDHEWAEDDSYTVTPTLSAPSQHPRRIMGTMRDLYLSYAKTLRKKFLAMSPEAHSIDALPIGLVDYLIGCAPSIRPKTFINYRSGLLYWINTLPESAETHHARQVLLVGVPKSGFKGRGRGRHLLCTAPARARRRPLGVGSSSP